MINNIYFMKEGAIKNTIQMKKIVFELENIKVEKIVKSRNYETERKGKV